MKSGWFWNTPMWQAYLEEYAKTRPECLHEWKSSPLVNDHDFSKREMNRTYIQTDYLSQVIDLRTHKWSDVRKSYHSIIHRGQEQLEIEEDEGVLSFRIAHHFAFGSVRSEKTFIIQGEWVKGGNALVVSARKKDVLVGSVLWIIYQGCAYYASAPSLEKNVMHAVIWKSLKLLKERGITIVELGQIDGETEKEKNIGKFKAGWGGEAKPFTIVRRA
jgi:hypothetical protein